MSETITWQDPGFEFRFEAADDTGRTVTARCTSLRRDTAARLYWDDQNAAVDVDREGAAATHVYSGEGYHLVQAHYLDGSGHRSAWVLPVAGGVRGAPVSMLLVRLDKLDPQAIWATWLNSGSGTYTLDWGDSTTEDRTAGQPPARHRYSTPGTYTVTGRVSGGGGVSTQVTVGGAGPAPDLPAPVATVVRARYARQRWAHLLFSPGWTGAFDHRAHGHHVDWGDGTREAVPEGTDELFHKYSELPEPPVIVVTDLQTGKTTTLRTAAAVPAYTAYNTAIQEGFWKNYMKPVDNREEQIVYLNDQVIASDDWNGDIRNPPVGVNALTRTLRGVIVTEEPFSVRAGKEPDLEGDGLYDFDPDQPGLITLKPFTPHLWWDKATLRFAADWGDGTSATRFTLPPSETAYQYGLCVTHWYRQPGRYILDVTFDRDPHPPVNTRIALGPTYARLSGAGGDRYLRFTLPDSRTPIRVDWGDGSPVLLTYPGSTGDSTLTHTYAMNGTYRVTVYAPLQSPLVFDHVVIERSKKVKNQSGESGTVSGSVSWMGQLEFDSARSVPAEIRGFLPRGHCENAADRVEGGSDD